MTIGNQQVLQEQLFLEGVDIEYLYQDDVIHNNISKEKLLRLLKIKNKLNSEIAEELELQKYKIALINGAINRYYNRIGIPNGFKLVPIGTNNRICINENGIIIDLNTRIIAKTTLNHKGYLRATAHITMNNSLVRRQHFVHRLVALSFIDNKNNLETVNHKDGNKLNNNVLNLEWMSNEENIRHSYTDLNVRDTSSQGENNGRSKLTENKVITYRTKFENNEISISEIMKIENMSHSAIKYMLSKKLWKHI